MHCLVTGGTGFIGSALVPALNAAGYSVTVLTRKGHQSNTNVTFVNDLAEVASPVDAVVNLAGASLADKRWSANYKAEIRDSRILTTEALVSWMDAMPNPPGKLVSGSAIGYYGASNSAVFSEESLSGDGFAAELCRDWESAALSGASDSTKVALVRLGVVFDSAGGALEQMLQSFRFGVGSWVGDGHQWLSWIHREDVVRAILFLLQSDSATGAFNLVAPEPVTHRGFCKAVTGHKRVLFSAGVPAPVLRALVGEMADELLLNGQKVVPNRLLTAGFHFDFPTLDQALANIVARG